MKCKVLLAAVTLLLAVWNSAYAYVPGKDDCWVCRKPLTPQVYSWMDGVDGVKRFVCALCVDLPNTCYLCGLPVKTNYTDLKDERYLCERDAKSVMLDEAKIKELCQDTGPTLDKHFSRYLTFPTNINFHVVDRLTLVDLFKIPGKDYTCPNVLGYTSMETNEEDRVEFSISILSGQTPAATEATCAHELSHAWMLSNISSARRKELNRDSVEGFCELVSFMLMRDKNETVQMADARANRYTRGQLDLFIEAEQKFGFSDVLDWVRQGDSNRLKEGEIWRIRDMKVWKNTNQPPPVPTYASLPAAPLPDRLILKSISLGGKAPTALINQCTLGVGETGKVKLAGTNLVIRCKEIKTDSVLVEVVGSDKSQELRFEAKTEK